MLALRDLSHDPKLAEALGNMVVAWAYAEETLIFSLARVADINLNMALAGLHRLPTFESASSSFGHSFPNGSLQSVSIKRRLTTQFSNYLS